MFYDKRQIKLGKKKADSNNEVILLQMYSQGVPASNQGSLFLIMRLPLLVALYKTVVSWEKNIYLVKHFLT